MGSMLPYITYMDPMGMNKKHTNIYDNHDMAANMYHIIFHDTYNMII